MKADDVKRLKKLQIKDGRSKRIVADQTLRIATLDEVSKGKPVSPSRRRQAVLMVQDRLGVRSGGRVAMSFSIAGAADGHNLKVLHVVDEFTREALAIDSQRHIDSD